MTTASTNIIALSENALTGTTLFTAIFEYPRIIHAEFMTHRQWSKNSSSSRAIPANRVVEQLETNMFVPEYWGKNQSGMKARDALDEEVAARAQEIWIETGRSVIESTKLLQGLNLHKQLTNRISECFQMIKVCASGTEKNNFIHLRDHGDAQPEIQDLAVSFREGLERTKPVILYPGDWHLPFFGDGYWHHACATSLDDARMISVSCAAQTSYRRSDDSIEKARDLFKVFFDTTHIHASPAEHQATPLENPNLYRNRQLTFEDMFTGGNEGATHVDKNGDVWSGNFKHFAQYRQFIPGNAIYG